MGRARAVLMVLAVSALMAIGPACGWRDTPLFSMGQYDLPQDEMLLRVTDVLRLRGYQNPSVDAAHGSVTVTASYAHRGSPSTFTVQCYRDGWVSVRISGGYVRLDGDDASVPKALRAEYRTFVMALGRSLGAPMDTEMGEG